MKKAPNWEKYANDVAESPRSAFGVLVKGTLALILFGVIISGVGMFTGWFGEAAAVAKEEFGPRAILKKYEWLKDASAQLDAKNANLSRYAVKIDDLKADYEGVSRREWDRVDKQTMSQWRSELDGIAGSYNGLAAEYNSAMAQFHKKFANIGDPPAGASEIMRLPKSYKPYVVE